MPNWTIEDVVKYVHRVKPKSRAPSYNPKIVTAFFKEHGIPEPEYEFVFCPGRRWRFDLCWPTWGMVNGNKIGPYGGLSLEVQGGIWSMGRHNRGAALLKEYEKLNAAAELGWRILYLQPRDLCMKETAFLIRRCLGV